MNRAIITPCNNFIVIEFIGKASDSLNEYIRNTSWLKWERIGYIPHKRNWILHIDTSQDKDKRLTEFAEILCNKEGFCPSCRKCPHDSHYEDYKDYFEKYYLKMLS